MEVERARLVRSVLKVAAKKVTEPILETESERKEREERYKLYEERRQKQRETEERYGGHEKYNKDLCEIAHEQIG